MVLVEMQNAKNGMRNMKQFFVLKTLVHSHSSARTEDPISNCTPPSPEPRHDRWHFYFATGIDRLNRHRHTSRALDLAIVRGTFPGETALFVADK